jgi:cephalosporin-C deacetylase-like acetyl esterase
MHRRYLPIFASSIVFICSSLRAEPLPETKPLTREGDLAAQMVEGIDKYLMRELAASVEKRKQFWKPDFSSPEAYTKSIQPNRERLKKILGVVAERVPFTGFELVGTTEQPALVAETDTYKVFAVRWPVLPGVDGEGLLLEPKGKVVAQVIVLPDPGDTPEDMLNMDPKRGLRPKPFPGLLAVSGCRVLMPVVIDREDTWSGNPRLGRMTNQPHREFIYRMAYEMGRQLIGYEVQKVLAAVEGFCREKDHPAVGIIGAGEGGLIALCSASLDERIQATIVHAYFGPRESVWEEPIYRNVFGLLREFGDAELARLILPRTLIVQASHLGGKKITGPPAPRAGRGGAAPGHYEPPVIDRVRPEIERATLRIDGAELVRPMLTDTWIPGEKSSLQPFLTALSKEAVCKEKYTQSPMDRRKNFDPAPRQKRQFDQLVAFTQQVMRDSERYRQQHFWAKLDTSSLEKYEKSCEPFRKQLWEEVIGKLPAPTVPMNPQTRPLYDEPKWRGYEVTLDLYPDVFAYGILLLPKDLKAGEKRPVVVCQHGLEGRPTDVCNPKERTKFYNSFGAQLADKGYIVYAPQNPYIGHDKFRVLQRKANPLGLSLFSFIIGQHERTLDWLATLPNVDPKRMAFYGLSYGGKTAMRVPALLPRYCLSICSGDFNEWIRKNVSLDYPSSYMFSPEYEMPEFNLGHTFNYAEMAALIAPRPFMVERGHDDGVGIDEWIAYEYAKVRRLYSRLKIPQRTEIEFFAGGHEIHGQGTFRFLAKHLNWDK